MYNYVNSFGKTRQLHTKLIFYKYVCNLIIQSVVPPEGLKL